ncbi:hypothetical protein E4T43_05780 [Aureobasidium subglaciale]|nr:hypothetical protein E4T43_05780 [Aureobasidium subglaciale]
MFNSHMAILHESLSNPLAKRLRNIQYCQYLLVIAIAKLMDDRDDSDLGQLPGPGCFAHAMRLLSTLSELQKYSGVAVVEVLALVATYLQWIDWSDEAYFYLRQDQKALSRTGSKNKKDYSRPPTITQDWVGQFTSLIGKTPLFFMLSAVTSLTSKTSFTNPRTSIRP